MPSPPTICLAASGGGHVRQLLDLKPFWSRYPHVFVTEDTALGRSIAGDAPTRFVPHFALGQARLGAPFTMLRRALASAWRSLAIVREFRPDVIVTTGAGSQLFIVLWGRLLGARVVLIDSFARFDRPSGFARLAGWLAHVRIAQSPASGRNWPGSVVRDPLRVTGTAPPVKEDLLFATVGATLAFPRLVNLVLAAKANGAITERMVLQVGDLGDLPPAPDGVEIVRELPFDQIQALLARARMVVCHGGTGSIITALQNHCATVIISRRFALGEHYDDHQSEITESFVGRGLAFAADDGAGLATALAQARAFTPVAVTTDYAELIADLCAYVDQGTQPSPKG